MVVAGRNPAGVLSGQRLPCRTVFSIPAFHPLTTSFSFQTQFPLPCLLNANIQYNVSIDFD
jgi:hypothetical protein